MLGCLRFGFLQNFRPSSCSSTGRRASFRQRKSTPRHSAVRTSVGGYSPGDVPWIRSSEFGRPLLKRLSWRAPKDLRARRRAANESSNDHLTSIIDARKISARHDDSVPKHEIALPAIEEQQSGHFCGRRRRSREKQRDHVIRILGASTRDQTRQLWVVIGLLIERDGIDPERGSAGAGAKPP